MRWVPDGGGSWEFVPVYWMQQRRVNGNRCPETLWPLTFAGRKSDPLAPTLFARLNHSQPIVSMDVLKLRIASMNRADLDLLRPERLNTEVQSRWWNFQIRGRPVNTIAVELHHSRKGSRWLLERMLPNLPPELTFAAYPLARRQLLQRVEYW